jgi:hypothetical protein
MNFPIDDSPLVNLVRGYLAARALVGTADGPGVRVEECETALRLGESLLRTFAPFIEYDRKRLERVRNEAGQ